MFRKLGVDAFFLTVGVLINKAGILAINILLARYSSPEVYGKFALLRSTVNLLETTLSSSINPIIIRISSSEFENKDGQRFINTFLLILGILVSLIVCVPVFLLATPISIFLFGEADITFVKLGLLLFFLSYTSGILTSLLVAGRLTRFFPIFAFVAAAISVFTAYSTIERNPIFWAVLCIAALHAIELILKMLTAIRNQLFTYRGALHFPTSHVKVLSNSLLILLASSALNAVIFWLLRVTLVNNSSGFSSLAIFDVSFQYIAVEMMILTNIVTIFQSRASSVKGIENSDRRKVYSAAIWGIVLATFILSLINVIFAAFLIGLFGVQYDPQVLRFTTFILPLYAAAVFANRHYINQELPYVLLLVTVISSVASMTYATIYMETAYDLAAAIMVYFGTSNIVYLTVFLKLRCCERV